MKEHILVTFVVRRGFKITGTAALDLDTAARLLLDMLYISSAMADNLSAQVEPMNWFQTDWDLLLGPFALLR